MTVINLQCGPGMLVSERLSRSGKHPGAGEDVVGFSEEPEHRTCIYGMSPVLEQSHESSHIHESSLDARSGSNGTWCHFGTFYYRHTRSSKALILFTALWTLISMRGICQASTCQRQWERFPSSRSNEHPAASQPASPVGIRSVGDGTGPLVNPAFSARTPRHQTI